MIAYKLFRITKDCEIASLFINRKARYPTGVWLESEDHPTKGYAHRPGWHSTNSPNAPHLSTKGRAWFEVQILDYKTIERPESQGGIWYLSSKLKIVKQL